MSKKSSSVSSSPLSPGQLVDIWQKKAIDLDRIADKREAIDEDCTGLRNMAFTLRECALQLAQSRF